MARPGQTVRFTQVVERSGQPHVHTLWLEPDEDPELQRAAKDHRVMMVAPHGGAGQTDSGTVGFESNHAHAAQLLIFPKSLKRFAGARVVGIKFNLVAQPKLTAGAEPTHAGGRRHPAAKRRRAPAPAHAHHPPAKADAEENVVAFATPPKSTRAASNGAGRSAARKSKRTRSARGRADSKGASAAASSALVRQVRAALKELKAGQAVAAYERLGRAIADTD